MGKTLRRLLITLVILVALVALGDRVANAVAERRVAGQVADTAAEYGAYSDQRPDVTIHGWPFLTQAWSGEFEQIDIELTDVGAEGLTFPKVDVVAKDVGADWREISEGNSQITSDLVEVTGTVSVDTVEALLRERTGHDMNINDDGTASINTTVDVFGTQIEISGTGGIEIRDGLIEFTPDVVEAVTGAVPDGAEAYVEQVKEEMSTQIPLPPLPWGVQLTELRISGETVAISGTASDVVLN